MGASLMCTKFPRQTLQPLLLGSICEMVGIGMLAYALWEENDSLVYGMMVVTGVGVGFRFMPGTSSSSNPFSQWTSQQASIGGSFS